MSEPFSIRRWAADLPVSSIGWVFIVSGVLFWGGGASRTITGLAHDRSLEQEGRIADGTVQEKTVRSTSDRSRWRFNEGRTIETYYFVTFRFSALGEGITDTVEVDKDVWDRLQEQGSIRVTYVPEKPEIHRVEGQDAEFQLLKVFLFVVGGGVMLYVGRLLLAGKLQLSSESESEN